MVVCFFSSCSHVLNFSRMSFHPRKLFFPYLGSSDAATMGSRINGGPSPSPLPSPVSMSFPRFRPPLLDGDDMHQNLAPIIIIGIGSIGCVIMFLITLSKILKYYYLSRYNVSRRNPPILFDIRGDFTFSDDEEQEQVIRQHPIWFVPTEGLQESTIDSITVYRYRKDEGLVKEIECLVCLGEFQQEESLRLLPKCSHAFHVPCIDTWLRSHKTCPLCRASIAHDAGSVGGGTESDSSFSDIIEDMDECNGGGVRVGDEDSSVEGRIYGIEVLSECGEVSGHSSILIGSASDVGTQAQAFDEENESKMKRSFSLDSSSASMVFHDVLDIQSLDTNTNTNLVVEKKASISGNKDDDDDVGITKEFNDSTTEYKVASIEHELQERHLSLRFS
ncbi:unnamed protein product [Sphenostylis stenocarpa]|uniref:RING-type E3 ubiquitin transferase n=1 Tax=Sphenostylis stenocarpa TaxID=92480 RepID=A0AA86V6C6_9FABA|nr:unnamed protein product [Sphenostylis stenocarpa]